ncbi:MAG: hypothetical protein ACI4MZ_05280 [Christensenellales bacterium]
MKTARLQKIKRICLISLMVALTVIFCFVPISFGTISLALMILPTIIVAQVCDFKTSLAMGVFMGLINYVAWFTTKAALPTAPIFQNPLVCILPRMMIAVTCYVVRVSLQRAVTLGRLKKYKVEYARILPVADLGQDVERNALSDEDVVGAQPSDEKIIRSDSDDVHKDDNPSNLSVANKNRDGADGRRKRARTAIQDGVLNQLIHALSAGLGVVTNTLFVAIFTLLFFNGTSIAQTVVTVEYVLAWFGVNFAVELVSFSLITPPIVLAIKSARLA